MQSLDEALRLPAPGPFSGGKCLESPPVFTGRIYDSVRHMHKIYGGRSLYCRQQRTSRRLEAEECLVSRAQPRQSLLADGFAPGGISLTKETTPVHPAAQLGGCRRTKLRLTRDGIVITWVDFCRLPA